MSRTIAGVALVAVLLAGGAGAQEEQKPKTSGGLMDRMMGVVGMGKKKPDDEAEKKDATAEAPAKKSAGGLFSVLAGAPAKKPESGETTTAPPPPPPPVRTATTARTLVPGQAITATLEDAPTSPNGNLYHCYRLNTGRGSQWVITVDQKKRDGKYLAPLVIAGDGCIGAPSLQVQRNNSYLDLGYFGGTGYRSTTAFNSGGGAYYIAVVAKPAEGFGEYKITATRTAADGTQTAGLLATDAEIRFGKSDGSQTASTVEPREGKKYAVGDLIKDCPECPQLVVIPKGSFIMGTSASEEDRNGDEGPAHRVTFARPFAMGVTEVTFDEYDACARDGGCARVKDNWGRGKRPAANVTWADASAYAAWLSKTTGERYFLPSEAEWEYAARAGTRTPWNTGSGIVSDDANIMNAFKQTVPVGGFPANAWGLKDMHGNVWEWTLDCYEVGYFGVPADGGAGVTPNCPNRVVRGGGYDSEPKFTRSAQRYGSAVGGSSAGVGFRVARAL